ncbi:MAG: SCO family protein [Rhodobacteraceae bacterium]|nr:SCO family protein [Paracoccaceae bacterium]
MPRSSDRFAQCRASVIAGGSEQIGGAFTLVNQHGQSMSQDDVSKAPALLYFGYTFCPDICPMDTMRNVEAVDLLETAGQNVTPVFITIDPERDTPQVLAEFAEVMHPRLIALTGSDAQIKTASKAFRTYYKAHDQNDPYYLVDHSTMSYLLLPEHGFVEFFRRDLPAEQVAEKISCFLNAA